MIICFGLNHVSIIDHLNLLLCSSFLCIVITNSKEKLSVNSKIKLNNKTVAKNLHWINLLKEKFTGNDFSYLGSVTSLRPRNIELRPRNKEMFVFT